MNTTLSNVTDVIPPQEPLSTRRPIPVTVLASLIGFLAVLGNGLVLIILGRNSNLLESTRKFCLHLAVTDLGNGILTFVIIYSTMVSARTRVDLCICITLLVQFFAFASQAIVTANTFERYVGICKRHDYARLMKKSTVYLLLVLAWFYPVVLVSTSVIGFSQSIYQSSCYYHRMFEKWVYLVQASIMFSIATFNVFLFGFIISKAREFYKRVSPASLQGTSNAASRNREMKKSIRNGKMMGIVTAAFFFCWTPYNVYQIYIGMDQTVSDSLVSVANIMYILGIFNSTINPFIYVWQKKEFRNRCKTIFKCKQSQQVTLSATDSSSRTQQELFSSKRNATNRSAVNENEILQNISETGGI